MACIPLRYKPDTLTRRVVIAKVSPITVLFWVIRVLTTGMGEAASDYLGTLNLIVAGLSSAVLFAILILFPMLGYALKVNPIVTFWTAYVLTRPLGAAIADWLGKPHTVGGVGSATEP